MDTVNIILDVVLVLIAVWMILTVRGFGGVVGRTMNLITYGAIITGLAHLIATLEGRYLEIDNTLDAFIHRMIVLFGFALLAAGFRQIKELKM